MSDGDSFTTTDTVVCNLYSGDTLLGISPGAGAATVNYGSNTNIALTTWFTLGATANVEARCNDNNFSEPVTAIGTYMTLIKVGTITAGG
ncbi:MAG: hypothetical protein NTZ03_12205 [Actinobacteria bacterium]|nr:hypothetical protein [Actinomycetota bacterium]